MEQARLNGNSPTGASAVAIDPWTGAIKAIVSYPTFNQKLAAKNPNYLSQLYKEQKTTPTLNRAIGGVYPTGSTFKPIIAEAALSAGIITPSTYLPCTGSFTLGNHTFYNVERGRRRRHESVYGARAVVRHVVLPSRRADLGR